MNNENKSRIYGIDPGSIKDVDEFNNLDEIDLWMNIDGLGFYLWYCNHEMADGRMSRVDLTEEQYAMEYMVYQTKKFGVELRDPEEGKPSHLPDRRPVRHRPRSSGHRRSAAQT